MGKYPNGTQVTGPRHVVALKSGTFELNSCNPFGQLCKTESWQTGHCFQTFKHSNIRCLGPKLVIKKSNIFFPPSNLFSKCGKLYDFSSLNLYLWLLGIDCLLSQTRCSRWRLIWFNSAYSNPIQLSLIHLSLGGDLYKNKKLQCFGTDIPVGCSSSYQISWLCIMSLLFASTIVLWSYF